MSYYVEYSPELRKQYPPQKAKKRQMSANKLLIALAAIILLYVSVKQKWLYYLVPGDPDVTVTAVVDLVQRVGAGESVGESVETFFIDVITHGT